MMVLSISIQYAVGESGSAYAGKLETPRPGHHLVKVTLGKKHRSEVVSMHVGVMPVTDVDRKL